MAAEPVVLGAAAIDIMRCVGPVSWTVLSALMVDAEIVDGRLTARASARLLAVELGLDKDTVARALVRLRDAGLIVRETARFERSVYRLTVPVDVLGRCGERVPEVRPSRSSATLSGQLALLEAD
jgi:hypothetical protein